MPFVSQEGRFFWLPQATMDWASSYILCVCMCMYVYICVYIYTHIHTHH